MTTDDMIEALVADVRPVRPAKLDPLLLATAAVIAAATQALLLGTRPHLALAVQDAAFWLKGAYTAAITGSALWLASRLGRPGVDPRPAFAGLLAVVAAALLSGVVEAAAALALGRPLDWLGRTWTTCGASILLISVFATPCVLLSARRLAPTRPGAAGAALGLAAGGLAATAYGLLYCGETSAAFVATWYTLGVGAAGATGWVAGRLALRW